MIFMCLCGEVYHNFLNSVGTSDVSPQNENLLFGFTIGEPVSSGMRFLNIIYNAYCTTID